MEHPSTSSPGLGPGQAGQAEHRVEKIMLYYSLAFAYWFLIPLSFAMRSER